MQYSIVNSNELEGEIRLDPEYYHPQYLLADKLISQKKFQVLEKLSIKITDFGAYSQNNIVEYLDKGYAVFIRNQDVKNFFLEDSSRIYISKDVFNQLSLHLEKFDIVVQRVGSLGKAAIILEKDLPSTANQNLAQIKVDKNLINPFYLITFLNCRYGIDYFERLQTGNVQPWLNLQQIKGLKIPLFSEKFQEKISSLIESSFLHIQQSKNDFRQAQEILLAELGLKNWKPSNKLTFIKQFLSQDLVRIDAEYHQPKYDELVSAIKAYNGGWDFAKKILTPKDENFSPIENTKYRYIELSNIGENGEILGHTLGLGQELPTRARRMVSKNNVIVSSIEGSLSSIALIRDNYDGALCSTGFFVIQSKKLNPETLLVFLKSSAGQLQLKKGCSGTILTAIGQDEFEKIIFPIIRDNIQQDIQQKVRQSFLSKDLSDSLRNCAVHAVELAIEKNEERALKSLAQQLESMEKNNNAERL